MVIADRRIAAEEMVLWSETCFNFCQKQLGEIIQVCLYFCDVLGTGELVEDGVCLDLSNHSIDRGEVFTAIIRTRQNFLLALNWFVLFSCFF